MTLIEHTMVIPLHNRQGGIKGLTLIDDADYDRTMAVGRWNLTKNGYVVHNIWNGGHQKALYLHRFLLGLDFGDKRQGDHRNRDRLDNRSANLRIVTAAVNGANVPSQKGSSKYRGVTLHKASGLWRCQVVVNGESFHLGYFRNEDEAGVHVATWRLKHTAALD